MSLVDPERLGPNQSPSEERVDAPTGHDATPRDWRLAAVVLVAAVVAVLGRPSPTGNAVADVLIVGGGVAVTTWLGAASRGVAILAVLAAGMLAARWIGVAIGIVAGALGYFVPQRSSWDRVVNATLVGVALNLLTRSELGGFLGLSAILGVSIAALIATIGVHRGSARQRRVITFAVGGMLVVAIVATVALGIGVAMAADDLRTGNDLAEDGLDALRSGDLVSARAAFDGAAAAFDAASGRVNNPITPAAGFVPGVAQHRRVVTELSGEGAEAARLIADELARIDLGELSVSGGQIDIDRVRSLHEPLDAIDTRIRELRSTIVDVGSPWLLTPVTTRLDRLADRIDTQLEASTDVLGAVRAAPAMLGTDEPRTYFIGFTTPSEARGLGGLVGNWAEMTIVDGKIEMTRFGRSDDLEAAGAGARFPAGDPELADWLRRYGPYSLTSGPGGTTGRTPWKNIAMSPDMSATGRAIAALYPQTGGTELDGVFVMDVYALSRLLAFTGPIPLPDGHTVNGESAISEESAVRFLLHQQYNLAEKDTRIDILEDFSREVLERLLADTLPPPDEVVDALGPMVEEGRLVAWMARPDEQAVFDRLGITGTLPAASDEDAIAIAFNNVAGNKIDFYLRGDATYDVTADARDGHAAATLMLDLHNDAPTSGKPGYVIGNLIGLPPGSNRTWVSVFSRLPVTDVLLDGEPVNFEPGAEAGYFVTSLNVDLLSGQSKSLTLSMGGPLDVSDSYDLAVRTPPVVKSLPFTVHALWTDGDGASHELDDTLERPGLHRISVPAHPEG